jgi:hypothetical protein
MRRSLRLVWLWRAVARGLLGNVAAGQGGPTVACVTENDHAHPIPDREGRALVALVRIAAAALILAIVLWMLQ